MAFIVAVVAAAFVGTSWGQGARLVRVPVQGVYWEASIGEYVTYAGELRITWSDGRAWEFLVANAFCSDCGRLFTLYGVGDQPFPVDTPTGEILGGISSLHMIGSSHLPGFSGPVRVDLASAAIAGPLIAIR
jgi:hypothetical protein